MPWRIRIGCATMLALLAASAIAQPAKGPGAGAPPAMPVKAVAARLAPAVDEANAVGSLRADESVVIRPEIAGRIAEIRFEEGQSVKKGALLATLDSFWIPPDEPGQRENAAIGRQVEALKPRGRLRRTG